MSENPPRILNIAAIGCGGRTRTYFELAARKKDRYRLVAAADPNRDRLEKARALSGNPGFKCFQSDEAILREPRLADVMIIGTQDSAHREQAIAAMEAGYDLLLEKPVACSLEDATAVEAAARRLGRRVMVCHVLRYTAFYKKVKAIIDSGKLGRIISMNATEGVGAWHFAHSYVRGHWSVQSKSSPTILAKCCHDLDIIRWLMDAPCESVSSHGGLSHYRVENAPADAPDHCLEGCPVGERCFFNAERYLSDQGKWLSYVCDFKDPADQRGWLLRSPWGRCVYRSDNDAPDHQVVAMTFANGGTASLTMTAFESGRHLEVFGTEGRLRGGEFVLQATGSEIVVNNLDGEGGEEAIKVGAQSEGYDGHLGGDAGLIDALYDAMCHDDYESNAASLEMAIHSHQIAFAAARALTNREAISLRDFAFPHSNSSSARAADSTTRTKPTRL